MNSEETSLLIVDDDAAVLRLLSAYIGSSFSFSTAASAEEADELLLRQSFKLVMTDIQMPGASGVELCRSINGLYPDTVVILMSGSEEVREVTGAMREGAYDCLLKPFDRLQVMIGLERALRHQKLLASVNRLGSRSNGKPAASGSIDLSSDASGPMKQALNEHYHSTLRSMAEALGPRDENATSRSKRVVAACLRLGNALDMSQENLIGLQQGALLHDIGRIGAEEDALFKAGTLSQYEWTRASAHVVQGLRIIDGIKFLAGARLVIGQHHERVDGSGYPVGLKGDAIHLDARIFAIADAFETIAGSHPDSRDGYEAARKELLTRSGSDFDPTVADAFLTVSSEERSRIRDAGDAKDYIDNISDAAIASFMVPLGSRGCSLIRAGEKASPEPCGGEVRPATGQVPERRKIGWGGGGAGGSRAPIGVEWRGRSE